MKTIIRIFLNGLLAIIPLVITFYIIFWLIQLFESLFGKAILVLIPNKYYIPGMGILVGIAIIFAAGILVKTWGLRTLYRTGELLLAKFPIVGDIYTTLKDFMEYILTSKKDEQAQVVMLKYHEFSFLGIVTRENFNNTPKGLAENDNVAVYLPMSYQIGGYTVYTDRKNLTPVNMNKKEAMQWALTAGVLRQAKTKVSIEAKIEKT